MGPGTGAILLHAWAALKTGTPGVARAALLWCGSPFPTMRARPFRLPPAATPSPGARTLVAAAALAWAACAGALCVVKYRTYLYGDFDLAIFAQGLLGALHGRWFSSIRGMYWLGDHSSLALLALAPLAALARSALVLPLAQAAALALGAWPVFVLARRRLHDERAAAMLALLWLLQPALGHLALFEFHPEALAVPALLGTLAALAEERTALAIACAAFAALAKEDAALPLAVLGALTAARAGRRRAGFALVAVAAGSLALSFGVLKPLLAHREAEYGAMYAAWGRTPGAIALALARHPLRAAAAFVTTPGDPSDALLKAQYWFHLLGPVLGLALLAPLALLPALPIFAEHMLSYRAEQHTIVFQYTALVLPFVIAAVIEALARLAPGSAARRALPVAALVAAALGQALFGPLAPPSPLRAFEPTESAWPSGAEHAEAAYRDAFLRACPARGAIVADFPSLAHLADRDSVHSLHHVAAGRFTFSSRAYPAPPRAAALVADLSAMSAGGEIDAAGLARVRAFVSTRGLKRVAAAGDLVRLAADARDTLAWLVRVLGAGGDPARVCWDGAFECAGARLEASTVRPGGLLPVTLRWRRTGTLPGLPVVQWSVTGARGATREYEPRLLGAGFTDVAAWPAGIVFEERTSWIVPADLPPGDYTFAAGVAWRDGARDLEPRASGPGARDDGALAIGRFRVAR